MPIQDFEDVYVPIQAFLIAATGLASNRVIRSNQGAPTPSITDPFMTYSPNIISVHGHGETERTLVSATEPVDPSLEPWEDYQETLTNSLRVMVSCNFYNSGSQNSAAKLENAHRRTPLYILLKEAGFGWRGMSEIRNLTGLNQSSYQSRHQCDFELWVDYSISDTILRANSVNIVIKDESGNILTGA